MSEQMVSPGERFNAMVAKGEEMTRSLGGGSAAEDGIQRGEFVFGLRRGWDAPGSLAPAPTYLGISGRASF